MRRLGRSYAAGIAEGTALVLSAPLSFYGGVAAASGDIIDHSHPDRGRNVKGRILVLPGGKGSSSSSSVLAEAIRLGTAPSGIIFGRADPILVIGCIVARMLYDLRVPMMVCPIDGVESEDWVRMVCDADGSAQFNRQAAST